MSVSLDRSAAQLKFAVRMSRCEEWEKDPNPSVSKKVPSIREFALADFRRDVRDPEAMPDQMK